MKKQLQVVVLLAALLGLGSVPSSAQISTTGPAGLARQMPRIYGPHMANRARIKYRQRTKHKHVRRHVITRPSHRRQLRRAR
jgi:hypothetical protein